MKNNRRSFFQKSVISILGLSAAPSLAFTAKSKKLIDGRFMHMVFFWLKVDTDIEAFAKGTESFLQKMPEVVSYHIGQPAGTPRDVVDNSYTMSLVVTFNSKEDQDAYQVNEHHKQFVMDNNSKWTKVQIYDSWGMNH